MKKNNPSSGNGPSRGPSRRDGNKKRKNSKKTRCGRPKSRPKDIFDMDPQPKPKKRKKNDSSGFDDIISSEYLGE